MAIMSFADQETEEFFTTGVPGRRVGWFSTSATVRRKLDMIHYASRLTDLMSPPGNRLEALRGRWDGYHSIRVNDQWRIVFKWTKTGAADVRVIDYH